MVSECWYVLQFGHWMGLIVDVLPPGRCYACMLADVRQCYFSYGRCCCHSFLWQMLLPLYCILLADVIAILCWLVLLPWYLYGGRCYCHCGCCFCHLWEYCIILWQMLLPSLLADVIAMLLLLCFVADVIVTMADGIVIRKTDVIGRCYLQGWKLEYPTQVDVWSDVMTMCGRMNGYWVLSFYFSSSSGLLHRTSCHIWGRWYLPMFLFRDGLFTLM